MTKKEIKDWVVSATLLILTVLLSGFVVSRPFIEIQKASDEAELRIKNTKDCIRECETEVCIIKCKELN